MDGTLAGIFLIASLTDMGLNFCDTGCLATQAATPRLSFQAAEVIFDETGIGHEAYLGYDLPRSYGPFQPSLGVSVTDTGDLWAGIGAKWTHDGLPGGWFVEASLMPGAHARGDGPDLGGTLQFRSALGLGYEFAHGATLSLLYDHRSNGDRLALNPGLETLSIRYAITLD